MLAVELAVPCTLPPRNCFFPLIPPPGCWFVCDGIKQVSGMEVKTLCMQAEVAK